MGLFDFFSSEEAKRAKEIRTGAAVPDRSERKRCWDARDGFFACLDKHDVIDSLSVAGKKIAERECAAEMANMDQNCATAWVEYFKKFRVADYKKKKMLEKLEQEGASKMDVDSGFNGAARN